MADSCPPSTWWVLQTSQQFAHVRQHGITRASKTLVVNVAPAPDQQLRLGIIVSKKYNTKAVARNRARRIIRESFRLLFKQIKTPVWIVVIARRPLMGKKMQDVRQDMDKFLAAADLYSSRDSSIKSSG